MLQPAYAVDPAPGLPVRGIDTSHFQREGGAAINWPAVAAGGKRFAFINVTEGATFTDEWFARDIQGAAQAGIARAPNHFLSYSFKCATSTEGEAVV